MTSKPALLDNLHDFYQPPPPAWTPQTIGWYFLFAIAGLLLLWAVAHLIRAWLANRYRREALNELALLPPEQFSALLNAPRSPRGRAKKWPPSTARPGSPSSTPLRAPLSFRPPPLTASKSSPSNPPICPAKTRRPSAKP